MKNWTSIKRKMRKEIDITISKDLIEWLDLQVRNKRFADRSEGCEYCVENYRKSKRLRK